MIGLTSDDVVIMDREKVRALLKEKLSTEWIIIMGEPEAIVPFWYMFYPPGTPDNADLGLVVLPTKTGGVVFFFLARKEESIREFLHISREQMESLIGLGAQVSDVDGEVQVRALYAQPGKAEDAIDNLLNAIFSVGMMPE